MRFFYSLFFVLFSIITYSQNWVWGRTTCKQFPPQNIGVSITSDAEGNVYYEGQAKNILEFGADSSTYNGLSALSSLYIKKFNYDGKLVWCKYSKFTKNLTDVEYYSAALFSDNSSNLYLTGLFEDSIAFESFKLIGEQTYPHEFSLRLMDKTWNNGFVFKFNSLGRVLWAKRIWGDTLLTGIKGTTDINGNIYLTGNFSGRLVLNTIDTIKAKGFVFFIAKYDSMGNFLWYQNPMPLTNESRIWCSGLVTDSKGNVYLTGSFNSSIRIGKFKINTPIKDAFLVKLAPSGKVIWVRQSSTNEIYPSISSNAITKDNNDNIYITGWCDGSVKFGNKVLDVKDSNGRAYSKAFIVKYNSAGDVSWTKESSSIKDKNYWSGYSVFADDSDRIYLSGGMRNWHSMENDTSNIYIDKESKISGMFSNNESFSFFEQYNATDGKLICANIFPDNEREITEIAGTHSGKYIYIGGVLTWPLHFGNDSICGPYIARWQPCKNFSNLSVPIVKVNCGDIIVKKVFNPPYQFIFGGCLKSFNIIIYNSAGKELFASNKISNSSGEYNNSWNGEYNGIPEPNGTYNYVLKAVLTDGTVIERKGEFELKR